MTEPRTVYVITDAPPRTACPHPDHARPVRRAGVLVCAAVALISLVLVSGLIPDAYGLRWWLYGAVLGWLVWPWLARIRAFAVLLFGALDALVTAYVGMPRLAHMTRRIAEIIRETARKEEP